MNDITVLIPIHTFNEEIRELTENALKSVNDCEYHNGNILITIVCPENISSDIQEKINLPENTTIIINTGNTDFCSQVNFAVDKLSTPYFSVLEFDDYYRPKWFNQFSQYLYGNESISIFIPLNAVHENRENWHFANEFGLSNAFITDEADDTDDIGIINFKRIKDCSLFNLTGAIINRDDFIRVGKYKPSIKIAFDYELLLRLTNKGLKCMVVPKVGYVHNNGRKDSLSYICMKNLTQEDITKWYELAFREYVYEEDRGKDIINTPVETLK